MRNRQRSPASSSSSSRSRSPSRSRSRSPSPRFPSHSPSQGSRSRSPSSQPTSPRAYQRAERGDGNSSEKVTRHERGTRVHVGSLAISTSTRSLRKVFSRFGDLLDLWMARTQPCFAFVVFKHKEDALHAIRCLDGEPLNNRRMRVTMARPRTKGTRSGGAFNPYLRCYQCGKMGHFSRVCRAHQWSSPSRPRRDNDVRQESKYNLSSRYAKRHYSSGDSTLRQF